ncbi:hypothetical protein MK805_14885 [Shimazuella sp. AN120528]|uniref:hypothetical protein n=1 Tax=Shimazuella soli TaxID=1892854 RepID=UPI001F100D82|nr:hypothetical protein [Shimazuella soli]MCH5586225.1 hypothetical protein [Shimazuella soli]
MSPNPYIRSFLSKEFSNHHEIPQDGDLERAADVALRELKRHGVQERADWPLLDLPLHLKVRFIVEVLNTVPDMQFLILIRINGRIDWALDAINKRLQVLRVAYQNNNSPTSLWRRSCFSDY